MKFLVVGLGSMGKRRIRNLLSLKAGEIIGFDPRQDRRDEALQRYGIRTVDTFDAGLEEGTDALIISTPPDLHMRYAIPAVRAGKHFFTEASVTTEGMRELIDECRDKKTVAAPSCTMRFHPSIKKIKEIVTQGVIGTPLAVTYHSGQYLPDWHPWEDYRKFYAAKRETGACREIVPFELTWLTWVFGRPAKISCFKDKISGLDVDIDDVYQILMNFESGLTAHLLVDVVARTPTRSFRLLGKDGVVEWSWDSKRVQLYSAASKKWTAFLEPTAIVEAGYQAAENMYIDEISAFLSAIQGQAPFPSTFEEDLEILKYLLLAERSSATGTHLMVEKSR